MHNYAIALAALPDPPKLGQACCGVSLEENAQQSPPSGRNCTEEAGDITSGPGANLYFGRVASTIVRPVA